MNTISIKEMQSILLNDKNTTIIDVREPFEFRVGHIKNAVNIPLQQISNYHGNKNKTIYLVCQSGRRSEMAANILNKLGYHAISMEGGLMKWPDRLSLN